MNFLTNQPSFEDLPNSAFVRESQLVRRKKSSYGFIVPISSATMWRLIKIGKFPPPTRISVGINGWQCGEIRRWLSDPSNYSNPTNKEGVK